MLYPTFYILMKLAASEERLLATHVAAPKKEDLPGGGAAEATGFRVRIWGLGAFGFRGLRV